MKFTCYHANIRFVSPNLQQQRIRYSDYTAATHLKVEITKDFVQVSYMYERLQYAAATPEIKTLKVLVFNTAQITEVELEDNLNVD